MLLNADNLVVIESIGSIRRLKKSQVYVRSWFGYKPAVQKRKVGKPARIILVAVVYVCIHSCSVHTHLQVCALVVVCVVNVFALAEFYELHAARAVPVKST